MLRADLALPLLSLGGLFGHAAFWIALNNRIHATGLSRKAVKRISAVVYAILLSGCSALALVVALACLPQALRTNAIYAIQEWFPNWLNVALPYLYGALLGYSLGVLGFACVHFPQWARQRWKTTPPAALRVLGESIVDAPARLGHWPVAGLRTKLASLVPGNQLVKFRVNEKELAIEGLPKELVGLSILHLSDLHFSGRVTPEYFAEVVSEANKLDADLAAVTGDICDKAMCLDWIGDTLGKLTARHGKFYVLGNHDLRVDVPRLRRILAEVGFVDVVERPQELLVRDHRILLCGNERPWFRRSSTGRAGADFSLRVLLSHSPDQLPWARAQKFDLMLAGHTHGGQIRFPVIGPMVCPSRFGVKYAGGVFYEAPTLMHVSRGISSLAPVRLNCPPEMTKLVLVAK